MVSKKKKVPFAQQAHAALTAAGYKPTIMPGEYSRTTKTTVSFVVLKNRHTIGEFRGYPTMTAAIFMNSDLVSSPLYPLDILNVRKVQ